MADVRRKGLMLRLFNARFVVHTGWPNGETPWRDRFIQHGPFEKAPQTKPYQAMRGLALQEGRGRDVGHARHEP
jgi:hypothetical protein